MAIVVLNNVVMMLGLTPYLWSEKTRCFFSIVWISGSCILTPICSLSVVHYAYMLSLKIWYIIWFSAVLHKSLEPKKFLILLFLIRNSWMLSNRNWNFNNNFFVWIMFSLLLLRYWARSLRPHSRFFNSTSIWTLS